MQEIVRFWKKSASSKNYWKVRNQCHYTGKNRRVALGICNLRFNVPYEISVVFRNGLSYAYHFIFKQLGKTFKGQFDC